MRLGNYGSYSQNLDSGSKRKTMKAKTGAQGIKPKIDSWNNSTKPASARGTLKRHNFSKTSMLKNELSAANTFEALPKEDPSGLTEQMPFFEMLKEFNKQQDHIIKSMKIYNKEASKNKYQLKNTMKKLDENKILRQKYFENKENEQHFELTHMKNEILQKQLKIQDMKAKTRELVQK